ncbi:MAG TPA: AMP-binding protein [Pyrinomonadaceae bacterium]|nr:AMP-binding protein [Pyrinomonadaceae bacterium]
MTKSFCQRLIESCETNSSRVGMRIVGDENEVYTFGEMLKQIRSIAYRLESEGVAFGDRVALIGENHPCWAIAYLGTIYRGAVIVPLDPHGEIETITNFLENSEAKVAFLSPDITGKFQQIEEKLGRHIPAVVWNLENSTNGFKKFEDWSKTDFPENFAKQIPNAKETDPALMIYTSGTTGTPKGVPLTHGNIVAELDGINEVIQLSPEDSILSLLPLFHAYLQIVNLWIATTYGCEAGYLKELTPDELSKAMKEFKPTILTTVPRLWYLFHKKIFDAVGTQSKIVQGIFRTMLATNGFLRDSFKINLGKKFFGKVHDGFGGNLRIAISAGSRFDSDVAIDFHKLGFTILQGYGLTETSGAATATFENDNRVGSVGKPMSNSQVKIDEPDADGVGEVLIKGDMVFAGYYKNPEATKEAFTEDGWFRSGDLGKLDKDGHLYIVGRKKDVIVLPNGKNVHPEDLEVNYLKTPLVAELAVLGMKDESIGMQGAEKLIAVIVPDFDYLKQAKIANSYEAIRFELDGLGRELPEYQRVREYIVRAEPLPRTATRKIKRFQLQKEIESGALQHTQPRTEKDWSFTAQDKNLFETIAGKAVIATINQQKADLEAIHPNMNLELDLGLDSLARAETFASLEQTFKVEFDSEEATKAFTVNDLIKLVEKTANLENFQGELETGFNWKQILKEANDDLPEIQPVLKQGILVALIGFLILKFSYFVFKILLRLEVKGVEELSKLEKPFIICPNHQSFLDGYIVPTTYPFEILKDIFHVGASEFFQGFFGRNFAKLTRIVPIDPDSQLIKAMKAGAIGLRHGKILNIYPEGERAFDGELHPFKKGAAILASELDYQIVPVALDGLFKVWARGSNRIRFEKVKIHFGKPLNLDPFKSLQGEEKYEKITQHLKETIQEMLVEMRKQ